MQVQCSAEDGNPDTRNVAVENEFQTGDGQMPFEEGFCFNCLKYEKVKNIHHIKCGDSIRFPKMKGIYHHHAIVEDVVQGANSDESCFSLTYIHLDKFQPNRQAQIVTTTKKFDLRKDVIEKVTYQSNRFTPNDIINRARIFAEQNSVPSDYSLFNNNCEHFATQCAQGVNCSSQTINATNTVLDLSEGMSEIITAVARSPLDKDLIPLITNIFSLVNISLQIYHLRALFNDKLLCQKCFRKKRNQRLIILVSSFATLVVSICNQVDRRTPIISIITPIIVRIVYKYVTPLILSTFYKAKNVIGTEMLPNKGDVVTFKYVCLPHEGVVSNVHRIDSDEQAFKVTVVHFPLPRIFGKYTVTKETIYFRHEDEVRIIDFNGVDHFSPDMVVQNALKEVGNQNHSLLTYWSSNMSRLCKTGSKRIQRLPMLKVRSYEDISPGDVIRYRYYGLPHEAVVIETGIAENVTADVIHYNYNGILGTRQVVEETFTFSIKDKNTFIHDYTDIEVYEPEEVVCRARSRLGEQKFNTFTNRSSHLAKWCKVKQIPS